MLLEGHVGTCYRMDVAREANQASGDLGIFG